MFQKVVDNYQRQNYNVAIYCRLSSDDGEVGESNSISNQKSLLTKHVMEKGWNLVDIYVDDGYSGLQFDRPGFNRMLEDIEKKKISLVITKDMSRLGRDYIQVGYYIERFFPEKRIRFIAINDHIDTGKDEGSNDIAPFKAIINDMYCKDISKKVKSVLDLKRKDGKFIGPFAPYGYEKDSNDKSRLIIDEEAGIVVKRIFQMYLEGMGQTAIAKKLNDEGILCPSAYKKKKYRTYKNGIVRVSKWCHGSVKAILINPVYAGNIAQNKYKKINYKSEKLLHTGKENWIVVENTHQPIIAREEFEMVEQLMEHKNDNFTIARKESKLFSGFVFCGDCGEYMTYVKTKAGNYYLICSGYKRYGKSYCSRHSILEEKLEEMILQDLREIFQRFGDKSKLKKEAKKLVLSTKDLYQVYRDEMLSINRRLEEIKNTVLSLYKDKVKGIIDEEQFIEFNREFNTEKTNLLKRYSQLDHKLKKEKEMKTEEQKIEKLIRSVLEINKLNKVMIHQLLEKVLIYENEDIKIFYKFRGF